MFFLRIWNRLNALYYKFRYSKLLHFQYATLVRVGIENAGKNNIIKICNHAEIINCTFKFYGDNNKIVIGKRTKLEGVTFWIGENDNTVSIGNDCWLLEGELAACEGTKITIGDNNLFSHSLLIRTSDSHSILDENGKRINQAQDIYIGNHVWIGLQVLVLKGANIGDNCIVGARSTITSSVPKKDNCILLGAPAKIVKDNTNWHIDRL